LNKENVIGKDPSHLEEEVDNPLNEKMVSFPTIDPNQTKTVLK
jgi:hypothetical protein